MTVSSLIMLLRSLPPGYEILVVDSGDAEFEIIDVRESELTSQTIEIVVE